MKQEFYLQFKKRIKNDFLSLIFANIAYFMFLCLYNVKKIFRKREYSSLSLTDAKELINKAFPHPDNSLEFVNPKINDKLDLSIVITVYNYADKLGDNIPTYLNQKTKYNYECIFVNDGSTDSSEEVIKKFSDDPKVKIVNRKNGGLSAARNSGINVAAGKYIMFIDCDDTINELMVEKLLNRAYSMDADIVMGAHNLIRISNNKINSILPSIYPRYNLLGYKNNDRIMNYPGFAWGKVYKRELFDDVRYPESYWYEDTVTHFLLFTKCKVFSYVEEPLYNYFWHDKNISQLQNNTRNLKVIDRYWLLIDIMKLYRDNNMPIDSRLYTLILKHVSAYYYKNIKLLDDCLVEALFIAAKELVDEYKPNEKTKLPYVLRQVEKAFEKKDINMWKLASVFQ